MLWSSVVRVAWGIEQHRQSTTVLQQSLVTVDLIDNPSMAVV